MEGDFVRARMLAEESVIAAQQAGLDTVAATGLIELGTALMRSREHARRSHSFSARIDLAKQRGAFRVAARAHASTGQRVLSRSGSRRTR